MYSCTITKSESSNNWRDSRTSGGGATFDMAAHAIDLVNYILGKPDKITGASLTNIYSKNVEDAVNTTFLYNSGISGILDVNWSDLSYRKPSNKIEIFCSYGKIISNQHGIKIYSKRDLPDFNLSLGWNSLSITDIFEPVPFYVRGNEFTSQIYHFIDCIINDETKNICTIKDAYKTLDIVEKIFYDFELNGNLNK
jgi:predicted dehydrogenase